MNSLHPLEPENLGHKKEEITNLEILIFRFQPPENPLCIIYYCRWWFQPVWKISYTQSGSFPQWITLVLVIGGRDYITPKRRLYIYIPGIEAVFFLPIGWLYINYILPTTFYQNQNNPLISSSGSRWKFNKIFELPPPRWYLGESWEPPRPPRWNVILREGISLIFFPTLFWWHPRNWRLRKKNYINKMHNSCRMFKEKMSTKVNMQT